MKTQEQLDAYFAYEAKLEAQSTGAAAAPGIEAPQHSPLPWHGDSQRIWNDAGEIIAKMVANGNSTRKANTALIVASVNHVEALVDAIAKIRTAMDRGLDLTPSIYGAIATLKAYEAHQ